MYQQFHDDDDDDETYENADLVNIQLANIMIQVKYS